MKRCVFQCQTRTQSNDDVTQNRLRFIVKTVILDGLSLSPLDVSIRLTMFSQVFHSLANFDIAAGLQKDT